MKKELSLVIGIFFLIIISSALASAVCCEKLKTGAWCMDATSASECNLTSGLIKWDFKICDEVPECKGTCFNGLTGECSESTPKKKCSEVKGNWYEANAEEVSQCQEKCCLIGKDAYFVNPTECKALSTQYNVQAIIRGDITTRDACEAMQTNLVTGACVISTDTEKACKILTNTECTSDKINGLAQYLKNPTSVTNINVKFYSGLLCTATLPNGAMISDCAPTNNTVCKDNKIYYRDNRGNIANVYDATKWYRLNNATSVDYWTYIKKDYDPTICNVSSGGSTSCGNCDTTDNTVCETWEDANIQTRPSRISNPDGLVCGSMTCKYNEKSYEHGESWCSDSKGTVNSGILLINRNLTTGEINPKDLAALKNASKYNLPGSRYYKLVCEFGKVLVEECGDYRNSVCVQGKNDDSKRSEASCVLNPWRTCLGITTRTQCEDNTSLCKWVPGYTWDPTQIVSEDNRKEMQGSCVPLIAPGFDFWEANSQGNGICQKAMVQENVLFETGIFTKRDDLSGTNADSWPLKELANRCLDGCYAIPQYAKEFNQKTGEEKQYPEDVICGTIRHGPSAGTTYTCSMYEKLTEFYDESEYNLPNSVSSYYLSARRGQYCNKDGDSTHWLTGKVTGSNYDCTPGLGNEAKDERKERDYPIFLTNEEWLKSITERARSIGDCGYKSNINGKYSAPETEIITAIFQKMTQKGTVKKNVTVEQIIYKGGIYLKGNLEVYETELGTSTTTGGYTCDPNKEGETYEICTTTAYNSEPCIGGTTGTDTCAPNMVCCVYPKLE
jgi:hypothetical protein